MTNSVYYHSASICLQASNPWCLWDKVPIWIYIIYLSHNFVQKQYIAEYHQHTHMKINTVLSNHIYHTCCIKSIGPKTEPWGTPNSRGLGWTCAINRDNLVPIRDKGYTSGFTASARRNSRFATVAPHIKKNWELWLCIFNQIGWKSLRDCCSAY